MVAEVISVSPCLEVGLVVLVREFPALFLVLLNLLIDNSPELGFCLVKAVKSLGKV